MTQKVTQEQLREIQAEQLDELVFDYAVSGRNAIKAFFMAWKQGKIDENQFKSFVDKTFEDRATRIAEDLKRSSDEWTEHMDIEIVD